MMHDVLQPTEIAFRRSSSVAHLYARLDRGSKAAVNSQDLLPFAWFLLVDFSLAIAIDDATGHAWSGAKNYRTRSRKKVSGRRFKTRSVGLVEAETFFCLAWGKIICPSSFILRKLFLSIAINVKVKFDWARCPFRHFCVSKVITTAHAHKVVSFFIFFQELSSKKKLRGYNQRWLK